MAGIRISKEWMIALPLIIIMFLTNVLIRSTDYDRFVTLHTILNYLQYLLFFGAAFISFVRTNKLMLANTFLFLALIICVELIFFFMMGMPAKPFLHYSTKNLKSDEKLAQLGYLPDASSSIPELKMVGNDTSFNVVYTIDEHNRRRAISNSTKKDSFALFFGCSVTYGYGVNDVETIPAQFSEFLPVYESYNYAYNGYGTQNMLAHLERKSFKSEITQASGIAVYVFIWHHILRANGDSGTYSWGWRLPYYKNSKKGIDRKGNFADDRILVSGMYEWLSHSYTVKYFNLSFPLKISKGHVTLATEIIKKSREIYIEKFGNEDFYVLIYPQAEDKIPEELKTYFISELEEAGVKLILGYSELITFDEKHTLPGDPHPNQVANEIVARQLSLDISDY